MIIYRWEAVWILSSCFYCIIILSYVKMFSCKLVNLVNFETRGIGHGTGIF